MIQAQSLVKDYGILRAVDGVSFEVKAGDILGFLGPNGAGKSTTMKMVTGFLAPTSGTARIGGHDVALDPMRARRLLGYLPENGPLYPEMTVLEFLRFVGSVRGFSGKELTTRIEAVMERCHVAEVRHQVIDTLSKGYRQRVGMAQAILHDPPCLVLDEPTDGLDPNQKNEVRRLIAAMAADKAVILSTHILEEVDAMCNRVAIIDRGRLLVDETPGRLRARHPDHNCLRIVFAGGGARPQAAEVRKLPGVGSVQDDGADALVVRPRDRDTQLAGIILAEARRRQWPVASVESMPQRLDAVFAALTGAAQPIRHGRR